MSAPSPASARRRRRTRPATRPRRRRAGPRISATRGFSLGTAAPHAPPARRPGTTTQRRGAQAITPRRPAAAASGQRVNLSLSFQTGSARLTPAARAQARVFGQRLLLPQLANMRFRIEGHTDAVGSRAGNVALSQRRAQSVAEFLVSMGVPRSRLDVRGYGPDRPLPGTPQQPARTGASRRSGFRSSRRYDLIATGATEQGKEPFKEQNWRAPCGRGGAVHSPGSAAPRYRPYCRRLEDELGLFGKHDEDTRLDFIFEDDQALAVELGHTLWSGERGVLPLAEVIDTEYRDWLHPISWES